MSTKTDKQTVTIRFAGDSGDGIQLTGFQFANSAAEYGNDLSTFPDFPAEIRAPLGTVAGVSGFQIQFGATEIYSAGDECDVLVVMNAAALKGNFQQLKPGGLIIANSSGFDRKNLRLAHYDDNPLENGSLERFKVFSFDLTSLTRKSLEEFEFSTKDKDRSKNMLALGLLIWMYDRPIEHVLRRIESQFKKKNPLIGKANITALKAGYNFGITSEEFVSQVFVPPAKLKSGKYRSITGNGALSIGIVVAAKKAGIPLFFAGYPITPASDILHQVSRYKAYGVKTFQAEDEIAAMGACIGAAYGGSLAVTASSGPGIALKQEGIGLGLMLELPMVICNIQRGGPSTGLPTKTEQSDLMQVIYGRNGEAPIPVLAPKSPEDCFYMAIEAVRIAIRFMTPVVLLSDSYLANGAQPWNFPSFDDINEIPFNFAKANGSTFLPYKRDKKGVRPWALPGTEGLAHRVGGLEKEDETGNVSYDADNHQKMVKLRHEKIQGISEFIDLQEIDNDLQSGELLIISWGSTYGIIKTAVSELNIQGLGVGHLHLRHINPFPKNLSELISPFKKVIVAELNNGQLIHLIRSKFLIDALALNKIKGQPLTIREVKEFVQSVISE